MSGHASIVSFRESVEPQRSVPEAGRLISGSPRVTAWNYYAEESGQFFAGIWEATRGSWRVRYTEHEFCHLLSGRVVITSEQGVRSEFSPGDSFVIPAGFSGVWEVLEDCRKLYAVFERADSARR